MDLAIDIDSRLLQDARNDLGTSSLACPNQGTVQSLRIFQKWQESLDRIQMSIMACILRRRC